MKPIADSPASNTAHNQTGLLSGADPAVAGADAANGTDAAGAGTATSALSGGSASPLLR